MYKTSKINNIQRDVIPTMEQLQSHAKLIPEIDPSTVILMLEVMQASAQIQHSIFDVLENDYQISEGKLRVMIILHQQKENKGVLPSYLADRAKVTRATISAMLKRMQRDGIVSLTVSFKDNRFKYVSLTDKGRKMMDDILPQHYLRISRLMSRLTKKEQEQLIYLLRKITRN